MTTASINQKAAPGESKPSALASWMRITSPQLILSVGLIGVLVAVLYYHALTNLFIDWWQVPDDSHGFIVPIFAGYLVWSRRATIYKTRLTPTWSGVMVIAFGLFVRLMGDFGANLFLSRVSIVILLTGFVICFGGWVVFRQVRFPLLVLLFAIPIPSLFLQNITFPMQLLAARMASDVLPLLDVPVLRQGNVIQLSVMKLEVAEACSGIRSLVSLLALAVFYGYFVERSNVRRFLLVLFSVPISITANSLRIVGTGLCVRYWDPDTAQGFFHEFSGWLMFSISLVFLFLAQRIMSMVWKAGCQP